MNKGELRGFSAKVYAGELRCRQARTQLWLINELDRRLHPQIA